MSVRMELKRDLAIILRAIAYEERHQVVTAITEQHGKVVALARNSIQSRRFGGTLDLFAASQWQFSERPGAQLDHLQSAEIRRSFEGLRKDFIKLALASVWSELLLKLIPEREATPQLFRLHSNALACLEESVDPDVPFALLNGYLAKFLQCCGNQPRFSECLNCKVSLDSLVPHSSVTCLVANAAWVCSTCKKMNHFEKQGLYYEIRPTLIHDFQVSLNTPMKQIPEKIQTSRQEQQELFRFLETLFIYHVPGFEKMSFKSLRFLGLESKLRFHELNPQ